MTTYGGYSSAEEQQRQLSRAYSLLQQRRMSGSPPYGGVVTAMSSGMFGQFYPPGYTTTGSTAQVVVQPPTVVTETKTVPQICRQSYWQAVRYWTLLASLSIISIWPAWARMPHFKTKHVPFFCLEPHIDDGRVWRYFRYEMNDGRIIYAKGEYFVRVVGGPVEVKTVNQEIVANYDDAKIKSFEEIDKDRWDRFYVRRDNKAP